MSAIPTGMVECPDCDGTGWIEYMRDSFRSKVEMCRTCGGWGYVDPADLPQPEQEESEEE